jgi:hypothetical protein
MLHFTFHEYYAYAISRHFNKHLKQNVLSHILTLLIFVIMSGLELAERQSVSHNSQYKNVFMSGLELSELQSVSHNSPYKNVFQIQVGTWKLNY